MILIDCARKPPGVFQQCACRIGTTIPDYEISSLLDKNLTLTCHPSVSKKKKRKKKKNKIGTTHLQQVQIEHVNITKQQLGTIFYGSFIPYMYVRKCLVRKKVVCIFGITFHGEQRETKCVESDAKYASNLQHISVEKKERPRLALTCFSLVFSLEAAWRCQRILQRMLLIFMLMYLSLYIVMVFSVTWVIVSLILF